MNARQRMAISLILYSMLFGCTEKKDLSPPPLNLHPTEALHVTVSFDRPDDANRYTIIMEALYQNQQSECGYTEGSWNRRFIYPKGSFEIPATARYSGQAKFDIYLDRYSRASCNWELAWPDFSVRDNYTGKVLTGEWGTRDDLSPGKTYRAICPFSDSEFAQRCFGNQPIPNTPLYNSIPTERRIPVTLHVSKDSAPLPPEPPSHFENFVRPVP
ncbi:hypothetical protein SAMN02800692_1631 [Luteibacter sp. UNC138MFCol5.1]|uniref:hypothetical protein n=1 Tax=Luteibacter sp. UNC138MFCol5.1 TaxID=1502774 RepID=UPI0008ADC1DB|nr:hypothetical protein [Luteibacter sp. UNC138MFCol5.1]SEO65539.1 hypothetical protein SAMN02800692_1631 [Luteibacter sp. UNC138MFCol5.1]